jgi:hypothetical protein
MEKSGLLCLISRENHHQSSPGFDMMGGLMGCFVAGAGRRGHGENGSRHTAVFNGFIWTFCGFGGSCRRSGDRAINLGYVDPKLFTVGQMFAETTLSCESRSEPSLVQFLIRMKRDLLCII